MARATTALPDGTVLPETSGLATFAAGEAWIPREQSLVAFSPAGRPVATVPHGDRGKITFRTGHAVCVAVTGHTICVDSATAKVEHRYSESLAAAGFGSLWGFTPDGLRLLRIDPRRGTVTGEVAVEATTNWAPLVSIGDRAVWVSSGTERSLLRIDPSTMQVTARIHAFGQADSLLVVACGYGKVWVQQNANGAGVLYRIDPATARITGRTALGHTPDAGAYGGSDIAIADGSVRTADSSPTVTRVNPPDPEGPEGL